MSEFRRQIEQWGQDLAGCRRWDSFDYTWNWQEGRPLPEPNARRNRTLRDIAIRHYKGQRPRPASQLNWKRAKELIRQVGPEDASLMGAEVRDK